MRFIGNKTRMLENINSVIENENITGDVFCDIFAGSGAVGEYFKLENKSTPKFLKFYILHNVSPFEYFNKKTFIPDTQYFITNQYSPKGGRQFFIEENAIKIFV